MQDHSRISRIVGAPVIAVIIVDGREIPIMSHRPLDRAFLQDYVDSCVRKPRQSAAEFVRERTNCSPQYIG